MKTEVFIVDLDALRSFITSKQEPIYIKSQTEKHWRNLSWHRIDFEILL